MLLARDRLIGFNRLIPDPRAVLADLVQTNRRDRCNACWSIYDTAAKTPPCPVLMQRQHGSPGSAPVPGGLGDGATLQDDAGVEYRRAIARLRDGAPAIMTGTLCRPNQQEVRWMLRTLQIAGTGGSLAIARW